MSKSLAMPPTAMLYNPATLMRILLFFAVFQKLVGAQDDFSVTSDYTTWDNDNWVLTTSRLIQGQYQSRAPVANGYIGCGVAAAGPFFEADVNFTNPDGGDLPINGWPLDNLRQTFCTVSGFFNTQANTTRTNFPENLLRGAESVIAGIPNWPNLILQVGNATLDATVDNATISNFKSSRSLKNGLLSWSYNWTPAQGANISVAYSMLADRSNPNTAAIQLNVTSASDMNVTVVDLLDGRGAVRSEPGKKGDVTGSNAIFTSVSPHWLPNISAYIVSNVKGDGLGEKQNASEQFYLAGNDSTIGQQFSLSLAAGRTSSVTKYVGIASSDGFADPERTALQAATVAAATGFESILSRSAAAWAVLMDDDLIDDYSLPDGSLPSDPNVLNMQIVSKANAHYLLQNLLPSSNTNLSKWSISVGGLGSDSYAGLIFWDADLYMSPGISISHPDYSYQIPNYRAQLATQARQNGRDHGYSDGSILYPWTSGRWGNCTGTGPCVDYQYHLNSDIFLNNLQYWRVTGDDSWFGQTAVPINDGILQMYSQLLKFNNTVQGYSISNLTDPDEYANQVPDGALTLASVAKIIEFAEAYASQFNVTLPSNYSQIADDVALPFAPSGVLSEYRGANNTAVIKQDDVDLINYPFDYSSANYTQDGKLTSLDYYANLQSTDGPAMTYSFYAISANALSPSGCAAYTYALQGFLPYARAPWYQFSEQQVDDFSKNGGTNPAFPFMTGAGGWHQVGPMGWLGLRTVEDQMIIYPALPPQIPNVSIRRFLFGGASLKATINQTHTTLTRIDSSNSSVLPSNSSDRYNGVEMPFTVGFSLQDGQNQTIQPGQTVTIENRLVASNKTSPGNILQCLPATSNQTNQPGQFPLAAIDGASTTRWQPVTRNATSMTVDLRSVAYQPVAGVSFDWGARPPLSARVTMFNGSAADDTSVASVTISNITLSQPYDANTVAVIKPYSGNQTFYTFDSPVYSGQYATLTIQGCQAGDGDQLGATVGEFNIYGTGGGSLLDTAKGGAVPVTASNSTASVSVQNTTPTVTQGIPSDVATQGLSSQGGGSSSTATGTGSASSPTHTGGAGSVSQSQVTLGVVVMAIVVALLL